MKDISLILTILLTLLGCSLYQKPVAIPEKVTHNRRIIFAAKRKSYEKVRTQRR